MDHLTSRQPRPRARVLLTVGLSLALALSGCGESDESSDAGATTRAASNDSTETPPPTEAGEPYYAGRNIEVVLPVGPGGGSDFNLQVLLPYLEEHIAGNPTFSIEYLEGADGARGGNEFVENYADAGARGEAAIFPITGNRVNWALGVEGHNYDLSTMPLMLSVPFGMTTIINAELSGVDSVADLENLPDPSGPEGLYFGAPGPQGVRLAQLLGMEVLDIRDDFNVVFGYQSSDVDLGLIQGELHIDTTSDADWVTDTALKDAGFAALLAHGYLNESGEFENLIIEGDVPTVAEAHEQLFGSAPEGDVWEAYRTLYGVLGAGFTLHLHEDAPQDAIDAFRAGAIAAVEDPEYLEELQSEGGLQPPLQPLAGDDLVTVEQALLSPNQDALDFANEWVRSEYPDAFE